LSDVYKSRLFKLNDKRISKEGYIIIKAQRYRTYEDNKADALDRLCALIKEAGVTDKKRRPTKPSRSSRETRLDSKTKHSRVKSMRGRITND
jgi:ribosome-associated protein